MPHEVFLSYSSKDKAVADAACAVLERGGVRVWIAPRDILPGIGVGCVDCRTPSTMRRVMVLISPGNANASPRSSAKSSAPSTRAAGDSVPHRGHRAGRGRWSTSSAHSHWLDASSAPMTPHLDRLVEVCTVSDRQEIRQRGNTRRGTEAVCRTAATATPRDAGRPAGGGATQGARTAARTAVV